ncbi:MAG: ABC transporter permease [Bifidobacteriaceae bacterium]|nr:ABC transporter permease [Bifidobacteriaceae bacterium]
MNRVWLVTRREVVTQARSKSFLIGTAVMALIVFLGVALPGVLSGLGGDDEPDGKVAVVGDAAQLAPALKGFEVQELPDAAAARQAVKEGSVEAALVPDQEAPPLGVTLIALDEAPSGLLGALTVAPPVELLEPPRVAGLLRYLAGVGFAVVFFMIVMMFGQTAATNTVIEKQTRVIEILLAAVPARVLLAGKVLGNAVLAVGTVALLGVALISGFAVGGGLRDVTRYGDEFAAAAGVGGSLMDLLGGPLVWFLVFFVVAFVMFSALMAGSAAMVSRMEDVGSVLMPTMMLLMIPYILVISFQDNSTVVAWLSYVPFSSPIAMPLRILVEGVAWWEPLAALVILALTTVLAIWVGGRLYSNSILRTGARAKLKEAFSRAA